MIKEFTFQSREEKKSYVERMFGQIAKRYDFFNHFLSLGFDYGWRRRAIEVLRKRSNSPSSERGGGWGLVSPRILDIACGTGDLSFEALRQIPNANITGVDLAELMLEHRHYDHKLSGRLAGRRECHIEPDWLLVYIPSLLEVILERTGSHSDIFE